MDEVCISNMSDMEIIGRMQQNNYEKFKTLVRMHLSFELDLNTDEFDLPCHEVVYFEKGKLKKWNPMSKKIKSCTPKSTASPPEGKLLVLDHYFIKQLKRLKMFILEDKNVTQEGIFRKTGSVSRQSELRALILNDKPLNLTNGYTVHDCATVFKSFLADLHEPVLTDAHYPAHCQIAPLCNATDKNSTAIADNKKELHLLNSMQLLLLLLPDENRTLLQDIIEMLHIVASHQATNKMSSDNLATLFAPHLICPRNLPPEALHYVAQTMSAIITYMVTKGLVIFDIPAKLATDIRAFFLERKRKKTMSPEQTLDESISDISTVNTVYTFVDREKTAAAHDANNTDTELAQLYAHIQSLPESSKKRRLIKQFNKQNGQGTPLQLLNLNRIKNSETSRSAKTISDSIKKHIFHKGIISRTPKRTPVPLNTQATPNFSTKNQKLRVLFQSPISNALLTHNTSERSSSSALNSHNTNLPQKSTSSTSLLLTHLPNPCQDHMPSGAASITSKCEAVRRTASSELESSCYTTPLKNISGNSTPVTDALDKKSVAWKDKKLAKVVKTSYSSTPIRENEIEFKSRYKSEPNLSRMLKDRLGEDTPISKSKSITCKLMKGVSMGNLRLPFAADSNRRLGRPISVLKCQSSDENNFHEQNESENAGDASGNEYDEHDYERLAEIAGGSGTHRFSAVYRNIDLITSTPSMLLGRRSMSPITKSTQRMPKAMQESIMTPRSRKPVMLTTTLGSSEQNQTFYQSDLSSFREQDEDSFIGQNPSEAKPPVGGESANNICINQHQTAQSGTLSNGFKEYLLTRSVLTASPVDSSFSSQPDDFGSTQDIGDLDESQLSPSLLYCLDGNKPIEQEENNAQCDWTTSGNSSSRKRAAACDSVTNKENLERFSQTKKLFISEHDDNPGETSF